MEFQLDMIEDEGLKKQVADALGTQVKGMIEKAVGEEVTGLKSKNDELLKEVKSAKTLLKKFDGLDIDAAREAMDFLDKNERAKLLKEGKFDELLAKETSALKTSYDEKVESLETDKKTITSERDTFKTRFETKLIEDGIRAAAINGGVRNEALVDILSRGLRVFTLAKDETLEARDAAGNLVKTKDDVVLTPKIWIESLKEVAPHYWPASEGLDAGSIGTGSAGEIMDAMQKAAAAGDMNKYKELRKKLENK